MAVSREEYIWNENSTHLRKLRKGAKNEGIRNKKKQRQNSAELDSYPQHWPGVKKKKRSPQELPRIETPPDHSAKLRGRRYEVVPPVNPRPDAFERTNSIADSWGADPEDNEDDGYPQYPAPPLGYYPYMYPPPMMYPPYPYYYPPPQGRQNSRNKNSQISPRTKSVRFRNQPEYRSGDNSRVSLNSDVPVNNDYDDDVDDSVYDSPGTSDKSDIRERLNALQQVIDRTSKNQRRNDSRGPLGRSRVYQLLNEGNGDEQFQEANNNTYDPQERYKYDRFKYIAPLSPVSEVSTTASPVPTRILTGYVNQFVGGCVADEFIPNILMDVLSDLAPRKSPSPEVKQRSSSPSLFELAATATTEFLNEEVHDECVNIVKETVQDLVSDYIMNSSIYDTFNEMVDEIVREMGGEVVESAFYENVLEDIVEEKIFKPAVHDSIEEVALEVLEQYDSKLRRKEQREIHNHATGKLVDSICLDVLMDIIARQGKLQTQQEYAEKFMEGLMFKYLLEQYYHCDTLLNLSTQNYALKHHHERVVTDAALDALLDEASLTLDQDMSDIDDAEHGFPGPQILTEKKKPYQIGR